jgi:hypothetical protein
MTTDVASSPIRGWPSAQWTGTILVDEQWCAKVAAFTPPTHGVSRTIALTDPARKRLLALPRESEFAFTTLRGSGRGELVRKLYGHPDAARARERVREAFRQAPRAPVPLLARS